MNNNPQILPFVYLSNIGSTNPNTLPAWLVTPTTAVIKESAPSIKTLNKFWLKNVQLVSLNKARTTPILRTLVTISVTVICVAPAKNTNPYIMMYNTSIVRAIP